MAPKSPRCRRPQQNGTATETGRVRTGRCHGAGDVRPRLSGDDVRRLASPLTIKRLKISVWSRSPYVRGTECRPEPELEGRGADGGCYTIGAQQEALCAYASSARF